MDFRALVLTALVCCIGDFCDGRKVVYGKVDGEVTLTPTVDQPISSITWKNSPNKAAEWDTAQSETDYYTICKVEPRCQLNTTTGEIKIMNLKLNEQLDFSAEINGKAAQSAFTVFVLQPVSKPYVSVNCSDTQCILVCKGTDSRYTKYSWKGNNTAIATQHVEKNDKLDKIHTCVSSNPVSTAESDPVKASDLFTVHSSGGIIAGVLSPIFVAAVVGCAIVFFVQD